MNFDHEFRCHDDDNDILAELLNTEDITTSKDRDM